MREGATCSLGLGRVGGGLCGVVGIFEGGLLMWEWDGWMWNRWMDGWMGVIEDKEGDIRISWNRRKCVIGEMVWFKDM